MMFATRRRAGWKTIGGMLLFLAFFFLLLEWQERDYAASGAIAEAVVIGKDTRVRRRTTGTGTRTRTSKDYILVYRFKTPEGETFEGRSDVSLAIWNETEEGASVAVEYKRDFPATNRIAGQVAGAGFWWKASALLTLLGIASFVVGRRRDAAASALPGAIGPARSGSVAADTPARFANDGFGERPPVAEGIPSVWHFALRSPFMVSAILAVVGAVFFLFSLPLLMSGGTEARGAFEWLFAVVGVAMLCAGGYLARRNWKKVRADWRLLQHGTVGEATVTAVEPTSFSINKVRQWRISYRYTDTTGRSHQGRSYYLRPEDANGWQTGDTGQIRFDSSSPASSVWVGRV